MDHDATTANPAVAAATTFEDMEKALKGLKDGGVTEAEAVHTMERLVEGKVEAIRTLTDTMSMQRAGRLTRTFSRLSPHTVEAATPSATSRRSLAPAELRQPARPSSAEASATPPRLGWVADAPRARGLLVIAAFATVAFAASRLRS